MNLTEILIEIADLGLHNARLDTDIKRMVNRAMRRMCERKSFTWLHNIIFATVPQNLFTIALPSNFKELDSEFSPVCWLNPASQQAVPCRVISRAQAERMGLAFAYPFAPPQVQYLPTGAVFIENDGTGWTLNTPQSFPVATAITYQLSCYLYPPDLVLGSDSNFLTTNGELSDALINLTKAIAYFSEDPSDPRGVAARSNYENIFQTACYTDSRQRNAGRPIHV